MNESLLGYGDIIHYSVQTLFNLWRVFFFKFNSLWAAFGSSSRYDILHNYSNIYFTRTIAALLDVLWLYPTQ